MPILSPEEKRYLAIREEYNKLYQNHSKHNTLIPTLKGISIIVLASEQSEPYIEECLNSIKNQTYFKSNPHQVIVAVDGSEKTLKKVESIRLKYPKLILQTSTKKVGKFVTLNNTIRYCQFNNIMHFNAEDVMTPNLVEEVMQYAENFDIIKFDYQDFQENISNSVNNKFWFNGGICLYNKRVLQLTGGFQPWVYAGDVEMVERVFNHVRVKKIDKILYYKREMPGDVKLGTKKHPRKEFLQKIRRYSVKENVHIAPNKVELIMEVPAEETNDDEVVTPKVEIPVKQQIVESTPLSKSGVSILVTAYKSQKFIEECLDSIEKQTYFKDNNEYEILLGIDACEETLNKVKEIRYKYRNLSVYMMKENRGTYVTTNTLINLAKYENLIRFDSDDVMMKYMVADIMSVHDKYDYIRFKFRNFTQSITVNTKPGNMFALGVVFYKKSMMDNILGGYQDWRCSGDYELFTRAQGRIRILSLNKELFFRREHANSLSNKPDTALGSKTRLQYQKQVRKYHQHENVKIDKIVNSYINISNVVVEKKQQKKLRILIVNLNNLNYTKDCIDDLFKQINQDFDILLIDQNSSEYGTKEYLDYIENNTNIEVIRNKENVNLNYLWNNFANCSNSPYLCFLNNDIRLTNNFTDDVISIFDKESNVGIVIHTTNNISYTKTKHQLDYEILSPPLCQGWDYSIRKEVFTQIPSSLKIFGGDDFVFSQAVKNGYSIALVYSSPIIHYKEKTRIMLGSYSEKIQREDSQNFRKIEVLNHNLSIVKSSCSTDKCYKYAPKNITLQQNKNCIYTALIGNYDELTTSTYKKQENWDYICFTDLDIISDFWKIIKVSNVKNDNLSNYKLARYYKLNFHKYLSSYENLIWKDSRMIINCDLNEYFKNIKDNDILFMNHGEAQSIKEEFKRVLDLKLESSDIIENIKNRYNDNGYLYDNGLFATGLIAFKNNVRTVEFFKTWWKEVEEYSYRDQLSANYAVFKHTELLYDTLPELTVRSQNGYFKPGKRKSKRLTF